MGLAFSPITEGSSIARPTSQAIVPNITTVKMYNSSLGHAGSP